MTRYNVAFSEDHNPARSLLEHWASRFTPDDTTRILIVERSLDLIAFDENIAQAEDIEAAMFKIIHRVATEQLFPPDQRDNGKKKAAPIKVYWREPVCVRTANDAEIIYDLRHATLFLKERWPHDAGAAYKKARRFCSLAATGQIAAELARCEFIRAAKQYGILFEEKSLSAVGGDNGG